MLRALTTGYSKKLVAFLVYVGVLLLNKYFELGLDDATIYSITAGFGAYTVSQGISDAGFKGKVQAESEASAERKAVEVAAIEKSRREAAGPELA